MVRGTGCLYVRFGGMGEVWIPGSRRSLSDRKEQLECLVAFTERRWTLELVAQLDLLGTASRSALNHRLPDVNRRLIAKTLRHMVDRGWLAREPPRHYRLTESGQQIAWPVSRLLFRLRRMRILKLARRRWSLPVLLALAEEKPRFNELKRLLPDITSRGLSSAVKRLQGARLVTRRVLHTYGPQTQYGLAPRATPIVELLVRFPYGHQYVYGKRCGGRVGRLLPLQRVH